MNDITIKCFLSAARNLSFTSAAKELFLSRQAVSRQIINLENELDTALFDRNKSAVSLTGTGELYYELFSSLNEQFYQTQKRALQLDKKPKTLKVSAIKSIDTTKYLAPIIETLHFFDDTNLELFTHEPQQIDAVLEQMDVVITYNWRPRNDDSCFESVSVETIGMVIAVSRTHPLVLEGGGLEALKDETVATWRRGDESVSSTIENCLHDLRSNDFDASNVHVFPDVEAAHLAVSAGMAITLCSSSSNLLQKPQVIFFTLKGQTQVNFVWKRDNLTPLMRLVADKLRNFSI